MNSINGQLQQKGLEILVRSYEKAKKRTLFDTKIDDPVQEVMEYGRKFSTWATDHGEIGSRKEIKAYDTIDYSKVVDQSAQNPSDMPAISFADGEFEKVNQCWYLLIPPLQKGVVRINRNRYLQFQVIEISEEKHAYHALVADYAYENVWLLENIIDGWVGWIETDQPEKLKTAIQGTSLPEIIEMAMPKITGWSENDMLFMRMVVIPYLKSVRFENDFDDVFAHFAMAVMKTNLQWSDGRPKAKRGSGMKIRTEIGEVQKIPKPQIVRTLAGGIEVKSVKPPRIMNEEIVRHYTLEAWNTRGHIRRYKSGKTVWIKPSVHHRKCLEDGTASVVPQTIIKVQKEGEKK